MTNYVPMGAYNQQGLALSGYPEANTMLQGYGTQLPNLNPNADALTSYGGDTATYQSINGLMNEVPGLGATPTGGLGGWMASNGTALNAGVGLLTAGLGAWQGYNSNKLAKQQMNMQSSQFNEQMSLSKGLLNQNMEDRQRARVASNSQAYQPVSEYMNKYGVK